MLVNDSFFEQIIVALLNQSGWEWLAAGLGILYVVLAAKESVWCWPAAFVSTLIYTVLFWQGQLPMQALLNGYYLAMAVYGFYLWRQPTQPHKTLVIHTKPWAFHVLFVLTGLLISGLIGIQLAENPANRLPFLDAFVTVFSVMNTYMMARKIQENWLYWIIIDGFAIALYWQTGYYVTIIMFTVYLILAVYGFLNWQKLKKIQADPNNAPNSYPQKPAN